MKNQLPPGQMEIGSFPRFGLPEYASRVISADRELRVEIGGDVETEGLITAETLANVQRVDQISDFHCVTTWSSLDNRWGGYRFTDVYEQILRPVCLPVETAQHILFRCLDGYRTTMLLSDLLVDDVILADSLDGESLGSAHGTPLRLVAPKHYGYKNPKHIKCIEFRVEPPQHGTLLSRLIDHPRARVAFEERASLIPGVLLRHIYRSLIGTSIRRFEAPLRNQE